MKTGMENIKERMDVVKTGIEWIGEKMGGLVISESDSEVRNINFKRTVNVFLSYPRLKSFFPDQQ